MSVLYIKEQGTTLRKKDGRIAVSKGSQDLLEVPVDSLENVAVIGNVQITTQPLHLLLDHGINVSYFTRYGKYLGYTAADHSKNVFLRFAQYDLYKDIERRTSIAKAIVSNKISNQIEVIRRHREWDDSYDWRKDLKEIERMAEKVPEKESSNELMGIEGIFSNIYFKA